MLIKRLTICFALMLWLTGCFDNSENQAATASQDEWLKEEMLTQLSELRQEVSALRKEVAKLNEQAPSKGNKQQKARAAKQVSQFKVADRPFLGDEAAKVAILEFTDYQCPYCAKHSRDVLPELKKNFIEKGAVKYQVIDYPLSFHNKAAAAAQAALCAGDQGNYWGMHDAIFENQREIGKDLYTKVAAELQLDMGQFDACLESKESGTRVFEDMQRAEDAGVSGTPKFFIGRLDGDQLVDISVISGAAAYQRFEATINSKLN